MQTAIDAYADPWQEGRTPATQGQFADALPLIPLPLVPVRDGSSSPAGQAQSNGAATNGAMA
jgi:nitrite reductase (NADH) large subunit